MLCHFPFHLKNWGKQNYVHYENRIGRNERIKQNKNDCFFISGYKNSWSLSLFAKFLGGPFLFSHLQSSLWVTSWLTLQYLATPARKNLCVPATSTQAERVFSWMEWLLKKEGFVCQENLSTCNYSWRTVLGFRLLLSLRCVFDNKLTPFISGNGFSR